MRVTEVREAQPVRVVQRAPLALRATPATKVLRVTPAIPVITGPQVPGVWAETPV